MSPNEIQKRIELGDVPAMMTLSCEITEAQSAVAVVSPLHRWFSADVTQRLLTRFTTWPTDGHQLLSPLVEWMTELDIPLTEDARSSLTSVNPTGKVTKLSQALLKRAVPTRPRFSQSFAMQMTLQQRLERAERWHRSRCVSLP